MNLTLEEMLLDQCSRYPDLAPADLFKALHQRTFGCGHFVSSSDKGLAYLKTEAEACPTVDPVELLGGGWCRIHLSALTAYGLSPETLYRLFVRSAEQTPAGQSLQEGLDTLLRLAQDGQIPFSAESVSLGISEWRLQGFTARHHSEGFRQAYHPAYRVIRSEYAELLPLLGLTDRLLAQKERVLLAIEGGSCSGKTTLAALLDTLYPDTEVFHMDDFFLRPEQRTPERFREPGGNVDRERFLAEVLTPLSAGLPINYRSFDCATMSIRPPVHRMPGRLNIIEGAYSMHPALSEYYDASVFLRITPEAQLSRLQKRNSPEFVARFLNTWIPLELAYFEALQPESHCTLTLEVGQ